MPAERLTMRKIRELLRLKFDLKLSNRKIAHSCSMVHRTSSGRTKLINFINVVLGTY